MIINTEWGAFGENGELDFVRTKWDMAVDEMSVNPGKQIFEKMISGMYMGELVRQVIVDLMKDDLIFFNCNREKLLERGSFYTRYASEIESDPVGDYTRARMALEELDIDPDDVTTEDFSSLRYICEVRTHCITLPTAEIISGENARAFLVCGFLMKSVERYPENIKKIVGAIWKLPAK